MLVRLGKLGEYTPLIFNHLHTFFIPSLPPFFLKIAIKYTKYNTLTDAARRLTPTYLQLIWHFGTRYTPFWNKLYTKYV